MVVDAWNHAGAGHLGAAQHALVGGSILSERQRHAPGRSAGTALGDGATGAKLGAIAAGRGRIIWDAAGLCRQRASVSILGTATPSGRLAGASGGIPAPTG